MGDPIDRCRTIDLLKISSSMGALSVIQNSQDVPFDIKRAYFLYDVPAGATRGGHAHKELEQIIFAPSGSFDVMLDDGTDRRRFRMDLPNKLLYVAPMIWRELENFTSGAVCMVLASDFYYETDYIREYQEFISAVKNPNRNTDPSSGDE